MALKLRPVKMKNSLYLLVPKGIAQLLEIDQSRECTLTADSAHGHVLKYTFVPRANKPETSGETMKDTRRHQKTSLTSQARPSPRTVS